MEISKLTTIDSSWKFWMMPTIPEQPLCNYVEMTDYTEYRDKIVGVKALDHISDTVFTYKPRLCLVLQDTLTTITSDSPCSTKMFLSSETVGLESPYWRPNMPFFLSGSANVLKPVGKRRTILEGVLFRICQIVCDLCDEHPMP